MRYILGLAFLVPQFSHATSPLRMRAMNIPARELTNPELSVNPRLMADAWIKHRMLHHLNESGSWTLRSEYVKGPETRDRVKRVFAVRDCLMRLERSGYPPTDGLEVNEPDWQVELNRGDLKIILDNLVFDDLNIPIAGEILIQAPFGAFDFDRVLNGTAVHALRVKRAGGDHVWLSLDLDASFETRVTATLHLMNRLWRRRL